MTKNWVVLILAIIGAIVVAGWVLKLTFKLIGILVGIGIAVLLLLVAQKLLGKK